MHCSTAADKAQKNRQARESWSHRRKEAEKEAEEAAPPAPTPEQESAAMLKEIRDLLAEIKEQKK